MTREEIYCDRNICVSNEYNGIGCDECEVTKSQNIKTGHWRHYKKVKGFSSAYPNVCNLKIFPNTDKT